jgi:hypothetical protein
VFPGLFNRHKLIGTSILLDFGRRMVYLLFCRGLKAGKHMGSQEFTDNSATSLKEFFFFLLLTILAFIFFAAVRNNTFWQTGDYLYLLKALQIDKSPREIFVTEPLAEFQPLVNAVFYLEFRMFGDKATGYYMFNVLIHSLNAFLVYRIVFTLLKDRIIALTSGLLFVFAVGNYGKTVMAVSSIGDLLITSLTLLTLWLFFRNELKNEGRLNTLCFAGALFFFILSVFSKSTSFSILGCIVVFNLFFRAETRRKVFGKSFLVVACFALVALIVKFSVLGTIPGGSDFGVSGFRFVKNYAAYLVRIVFPIQSSGTVAGAGPGVKFVFQLATEIRVVTFLCVLSYSVFGFIFGNRAIRFFIAWTYITLTPFCFFKFPVGWFNIRFLYLVSIGFVVVLASGTALAARLLYEKAWRRFLPYLIPLFFVLLSQFVIRNLDRSYEHLARSSNLDSIKAQFHEEYRASGR